MGLRKKSVCGLEIWLLIMGVFSFAYFIGGVDKVKASQYFPTGCCLEDNYGGTCQNMLMLDENMCSTSLVATTCEETDQCKKGCCYDADSGACTLNAPKGDCVENGGNWSSDSSCNIDQCQIGCCVLGEEAAVTTTRECTLLSREFNFEKNFLSLDADGSCNSYTELNQEGACVTEVGDYSGEKNCVFTKKGTCQGEFYGGFLCTNPELGTNCEMTKKTSCIEGKDQIYFIDSCGNRANIYDAEKVNDEDYWKKIISHKDSCQRASSTCGNCDYLEGSRCYEKRTKDETPVYGNYVCRDLSCENGKVHGESWCIYDYDFSKSGVAPVGSRSFYGSCVEGEIEITGCADFNQEICQQTTDEESSRTEAKCFVNNWRSCFNANSKDGYANVKQECEKYDQCIMLDEQEGFENYENFAGFDKNKLNGEQGAIGDLGKDSNNFLIWCLPKYTPGMQFWDNEVDLSATENYFGAGINDDGTPSINKQTEFSNTGSDLGYGGSVAELKGVCSLANFACVSRTKQERAGVEWEDKENPECNINAISEENKAKVPELLAGLNERCRSLGPCGVYVNIAGELGSNTGFSIERAYIDSKGEVHLNYNPEGSEEYTISSKYLESLSSKPGVIAPGTKARLVNALILGITGRVVEGLGDNPSAQENANQQEKAKTLGQGASSVLGAAGAYGSLFGSGTAIALGAQAVVVPGVYTGGSVMVGGVEFVASTTYPVTVSAVEGGALTVSGGLTAEGAATSSVTAATGSVTSGVDGAVGATGAGSAPGTASLGMTLFFAAIAAAIGYYVGNMIGESQGLSPQQIAAWSYSTALGAAGAVIGAKVGAALGPWGLVIGAIVGVIIGYISSVFTDENKYYIMTYTCEPWEPPINGDCESCNKDIRPCSEYRCKSLGLNCNYYTDLGEPGVCVDVGTGVWSADIKPWEEALTEGHIYTGVSHDKFMIEQEDEKLIEAWTPIEFGITTDKAAECKLDVAHTNNYDEMNFLMNSEGHYNHKITLSPHIAKGESDSGAGLETGENRYFIRCKNFAGQINDVEFAVQLEVKDGPDLTDPMITKFSLADKSYLGFGSNETEITVFVNEPSECKYGKDLDLAYDVMGNSMICAKDPSSGSMGEWPCYAMLKDLVVGENFFYFKCKDQPGLNETGILRRNTNQKSKELELQVCGVGLEIDNLEPTEEVIGGRSPVSTELKVATKGCIEGGKAVCSYKFESGNYSSENFIQFLNTGGLQHNQMFSTIVEGAYNITVKCEDEAGNVDYANSMIKIEIDDDVPRVIKTYDLDNKLTVITNENAECRYTNDINIGCGFNFDEGISMIGDEIVHTTAWKQNQNYYIKCGDKYDNQNTGCGIIVKTY